MMNTYDIKEHYIEELKISLSKIDKKEYTSRKELYIELRKELFEYIEAIEFDATNEDIDLTTPTKKELRKWKIK